ncbi:AbrB family transcriptional regulator [Hyphomicrobium nitrativorans NL23]|uniref:AbrB family transcriptional regulator n=1 Tax=Hyphomicrobium nitrativorans NL23 TaxID=1029756 RepID=V5SHB9_9HYPH|nr:AbrB/MazE/SpoVT family DNA-binding domain-containing protein [Hyphomicrobium nitrativorans]AHB49450.1 AbrB family transcriptional regulator [Hyphomicrobium nitrativorans NL23]
MKLEIKKIGNSTGLILPKELLARMGLSQGDEVLVTEGPDKTISIAPHVDDDEETMRIARDVMKEYRSTLKALAK